MQVIIPSPITAEHDSTMAVKMSKRAKNNQPVGIMAVNMRKSIKNNKKTRNN